MPRRAGGPVGPRSKAEVAVERLAILEAGAGESRTHVEQMCMSFDRLMANAFPVAAASAPHLDQLPFLQRFYRAGSHLRDVVGLADLLNGDREFISDTVRGWQVMAIGASIGADLGDLVVLALPFVDDHHFAVREWTWLALRRHVLAAPTDAAGVLRDCLVSPSPRQRRFAVEILRPRSVWGSHIPIYKVKPFLATEWLSQFRCERDPYVQRSVSNWLNDAGKSCPDWLRELARTWTQQCECPATLQIIRRAIRNLRDDPNPVRLFSD